MMQQQSTNRDLVLNDNASWIAVHRKANNFLSVVFSLLDDSIRPNGVQVPEATAVFHGQYEGSRLNCSEAQGAVKHLIDRKLVTVEWYMVDTGKNTQKVRHLRPTAEAVELMETGKIIKNPVPM